MLTKVGSNVYEKRPYPSLRPRLSVMERSLLKWAVIDRDDRVLDAGLGSGCMIDYLKRNMECEVCGVSDSMEVVRSTRHLVANADLVYANEGDIPWRDGAFDAVLLNARRGEGDAFAAQLKEINRVLKDGGQLVLGVECCPAVLRQLRRTLIDEEWREAEGFKRKEVEALARETGFEHLSWQRASLFGGVLIAWKHNPAEEAAKRQADEEA